MNDSNHRLDSMVNISYIKHTEVITSNNMWVTVENWINLDIPFKDIVKLTGDSSVQYSPYLFASGKKKQENWSNDKQNILIFDIDDGLSIGETEKILYKYEYIISTTKTHQKEKNNKTNDRYRVLIPAINIPNGDIYFHMMNLFEEVLPIDKQVNTRTGAFLGNTNAKHIYHSGEVYDCANIVKRTEYRLIQKEKQDCIQRAKARIKTENKDFSSENVKEIKKILTINHLKLIFEDLGYETRRNKVKLRDERTPSGVMYNNGKIVDYGSGYKDDIFGFLLTNYGMTFKDSVPYINKYI